MHKILIIFVIMLFYSTVIATNLTKTEMNILKKCDTWEKIWIQKNKIILENIPDMKVLYIPEYIITNNQYICIKFPNESIYAWDKSGSLIGKIGNKGKGPGEFITPSTIFFTDQNTVSIVDFAQRLLNQFSLLNHKVTFLDSLDMASVFMPWSPAEIIPLNNIYICVFGSMPKDSPRIKILDKNFKEITKFANNKDKERLIHYGAWSITEKFIILTDLWSCKTKNNSPYSFTISDKLFVYDLQGNLIKTIHRGRTDSINLMSDYNSKILIVKYNECADIFNIQTGEKIHSIKMSNNDLELHNEIIVGNGNIRYKFFEKSDKTSYILESYELIL